jgi:hypothetical protein
LARAEFNRGLQLHLGAHAARRKAEYSPKKVALGGNHGEGGILKAIEADPKLDGLMNVSDLGHKEYGWEYVPYLEPVELQGFTFSHYFASGIMGRPIGGEMPALALLRKQLTSCVAGHSHLFDIAHRTRPNGTRAWGLVAGCFMDKKQWESYAAAANRLWWRGLIILRGCEKGDFESMETITVEQLERDYGWATKN